MRYNSESKPAVDLSEILCMLMTPGSVHRLQKIKYGNSAGLLVLVLDLLVARGLSHTMLSNRGYNGAIA